MHTHDIARWRHDHVFGLDRVQPGERRTLIVVIVTAAMMVIEIAAGLAYGSMALLADGLHMASHAAALGISVAAYVFARRLARDSRFTFGTGKINSLAGFGSAILLGGFAMVMAFESVGRLFAPVPISFDQAIIVAVIGLVVNGGCAWLLLSTPHDHGTSHHHHQHAHHHHDHSLRAAYLHVLADALTSFLAIFALLAGKLYGADALDPLMGIVGAVLVARWAFILLADSGAVLLDVQAGSDRVEALRKALQANASDRISDLHVWSVGHGIYAAEIAMVSDEPLEPDAYKALIPKSIGIVHATVEVHRCPGHR